MFTPSQVQVTTASRPIWGGQPGASILIYNPDAANTVYLGGVSGITVGASNTLPLGPGQSVSLDGSQAIYACAPAGTAATIVIPGGSSFFQPTTLSGIGGAKVFVQSATPGGIIPVNSLWFDTANGSLQTWNGAAWVNQQLNAQQLIQAATITAAQVASATLTTAQLAAAAGILGSQIASATITSGNIAANTIVAANIAAGTITAAQLAAGIIYAGIVNGTTINAATFTGSTFDGTDFIINGSGAFFYLGAPAAGNLSCSVVPGSAQVSDPQGNKALPGFTYYLSQSGQQLAVNTSQPFGSGGTAVYLASSQAGPWAISSALMSYAVDLAGTDVNMAIEAATLTFSAISMQTLTPLEIGDSAILDNIAQPAQPGGAAALYASSGHEKYVSSSEGNAYNTGRLTSVINSPVTCNNTAAFTTIASIPVAVLTYKVRGWMLIHGGASAGTGRLNLNGPAVSQCAIRWQSATGTTAPVYNELFATVLGSFASQTLSTTDPSQLVHVEGTVTFSAAGTLVLRGQPITSNTDTVIIDAGSYLEIEPVT